MAAFRSRQQVLAFEAALKAAGLFARVIHTPHEIAIGCGLSVQFRKEDFERVYAIYQRRPMSAFVGFYLADPTGTRLKLTAMVKPQS